jgi:hypothetical protein
VSFITWLFGARPDDLQESRERLRGQVREIARVELRNANAEAASRLEQLKSRGVPFSQPQAVHQPPQPQSYHPVPVYEADEATGYPFKPAMRFEQDPLFGWPLSDWGGVGYDLSNAMPLGSFPREMYPERPTTLRTQIAQDAIRFQSRVWYETCPFYSGPIGHLRNYVVGAGMTCDAVAIEPDADAEPEPSYEQDGPPQAEADPEADEEVPEEQQNPNEELAAEIQDYLDGFATFRHNALHRRVKESVLNLFRDGEDALRISPPPSEPLAGESDVYPEIRSVDVSTIRGPHNEIYGPWAFGVLTDWPHDFEDVQAYHLWYPDNTHENVLPTVLKLAKLHTTGANVKRGVPLAYKIRKQLPQMTKLLDCMAVGEAARQAIPYIRQFNVADRGAVRAATPSSIDSYDAMQEEYHAALYGDGTRWRDEIRPGEVPLINKGQEFQDTPQGRAESGTLAYRTLAETVACALNVPLWFITGTADQENYASSLVSESPLTKTIVGVQGIVTDHYKAVCEAVIDIAVAGGKFPIDWRSKVEIHCELPSPIARDPDKAVDSDLKLLDKKLLSPQHVCVRNGLDFDEECDLIDQAEAGGWEAQTALELEMAKSAPERITAYPAATSRPNLRSNRCVPHRCRQQNHCGSQRCRFCDCRPR